MPKGSSSIERTDRNTGIPPAERWVTLELEEPTTTQSQRNAFLQPEAVVERLDDHRSEVVARVAERTALLAELGTSPVPEDQLAEFVGHLEASFDPATCVTCALFNMCRAEIRSSPDPTSVLVEIGIRPELRGALADLVDGGDAPGRIAASVVANVKATLSGRAVWSGQRRVDPAGLPGTVNVVLAKSDAAALGVHGVGIQTIAADGSPNPWQFEVFEDPQSPAARGGVMELLGRSIEEAMTGGSGVPAIHLVLPDQVTGDVLVSMADSLAGVETSRLRWQRDIDMGRQPLTYDGEPASVPVPLTDRQRLAVSFLLEEDRARAMSLRWPLVNLRAALGQLLMAGGPGVDHGRLDYLLEWVEAEDPIDHRAVSDDIASRAQTPGARLSNQRSDAIHRARNEDLDLYRGLVQDELQYKADVVERAVAVLSGVGDSSLRPLYRELEAASQTVWRRRLDLHASDLVRFGRTSWFWRNRQVGMLDDDRKCADRMLALGNPQAARDMAVDAGTREVALATVVGVDPVRVRVASRRMVDGSSIVVLHINGKPCVEDPDLDVKIQKTSFKFTGVMGGFLASDGKTQNDGAFTWRVAGSAGLQVGDEIVVADRGWLGALQNQSQIKVDRPAADKTSSPRDECTETSYADDPDNHQWCCRPHEQAEGEFADLLAERRARGELNPEVWPPVVDSDQFDTPAVGSPTDADIEPDLSSPPEGLTMDDLG